MATPLNVALVNNETGNVETFTLPELLEMINRDRSNEWSEYDMNSTLQEIVEIIDTMTEYNATA